MNHSESSEILAWLNAEQRKAERWGYSRGNTGVFRFGLTGPELMRIRAALGAPKERLYHEIQCPTLTKSGPCNCMTQIIVAEPAAPLPASAALQDLIAQWRAMAADMLRASDGETRATDHEQIEQCAEELAAALSRADQP